MLLEVGERIEGTLGVARAGERMGEAAPLGSQLLGLGADERLDQAESPQPALHRPAKVMDGLGLRPCRVLDGGTRGREGVVGDRPQRLPNCHAGPQGGLLAHMEQYTPIARRADIPAMD